jgi:hypothetical protein|tara:strand:+ start:14677 stop:14955 length:279 start_codon:yes stop_codon:yes gene_type:complete
MNFNEERELEQSIPFDKLVPGTTNDIVVDGDGDLNIELGHRDREFYCIDFDDLETIYEFAKRHKNAYSAFRESGYEVKAYNVSFNSLEINVK